MFVIKDILATPLKERFGAKTVLTVSGLVVGISMITASSLSILYAITFIFALFSLTFCSFRTGVYPTKGEIWSQDCVDSEWISCWYLHDNCLIPIQFICNHLHPYPVFFNICSFRTGILATPLKERFGAKTVVTVSGLVAGVSMITASFLSSLYTITFILTVFAG